MTSTSGLSELEETAREYDKDLAIELNADKILKWIGVYMLLGLAVVAKVGEILGKKVQVLCGKFTAVE